MDNQQYTYYAFISYQRKDEKWAKRLQRKLENYKLPVANAKEASDKKFEYIRPVFRDKTDLTAGPLPDVLKEALNQSRYLIVICSPNAVQSPWVNDEINTFVNAGRTKFIIPFIIDGEPYSNDKANECFPNALKAIPKEQEPLGVNIGEGGKRRAFIRTVAYMLGVKFDELWNRYERHRKKMRNLSIACFAFLAVIGLCIYDYTRTKVEYYADWVDCNGVAQGVTPLTDEQYSHRFASYKFEYTRVPYGEKGFYSWRLNKVSLVNSKGVISSSVPDNHAFFYPIQEYKYTDGYVTEIINRDTYNRVVMRYTIKNDYNHKVACLVDMEGKEKHQGSAYLSGSTTAFLSDANSNNTMSKIKRFHYTRNEKGYITKVTYHANDADDLDESAIGDNNNIYGKVFELDSIGMVTKVSYINHQGNPMTDKYGIGSIRYNYAAFEGNDTIEYLGSDGKLAYNEHKYAREITELDKYGNPVESYNEGADGKPCYDYKNIYRQVVTFDKNGGFTEIKYYDFDGELSYCSDNYSIQRVKYDSKGRYIEVSHYDINDKPCYIKGNYSIARAKYNSNDCIVEASSFDINDKPCVEQNYGIHKHYYKYDDYNYLIEESLFDEKDEVTISPIYHFAKQELKYDDYHQLVSIKYLDNNEQPCYYNDYTCENRRTYDNRGNLIKLECFDTEGKPCISKDGFATIALKYDNYGNRIEERYMGIHGEPIYVNMCASIQYDYYPNGLLSEDRYYDDKDSLCLNSEWFSVGRYTYDNNGNILMASYWDVDTVRCVIKNGLYSIMEKEYNKNGDIIVEKYYNTNHELFSEGGIRKFNHDNKHQLIQDAYFSNNSIPTLTNDLWHSCQIVYDTKGNVISRSYYGVDGRPCNTKQGVSKIEYFYDDYNQMTLSISYDKYGNKTNNEVEGFCSHSIKYDNKHRIIEDSFFEKNGMPCWSYQSDNTNTIFISKVVYSYDNMNNNIERQYFAPDGSYSLAYGGAIHTYEFDKWGRVIKFSNFDGNYNYCNGFLKNISYEEHMYNVFNKISQISYFNSNGDIAVKLCFNYDSKGQLISEEYRNDKDSLMRLSDPEHLGSAKVEVYRNERNLISNIIYYNQYNMISENDDGIAEERYYYDEKGYQIVNEFYNSKGEPVESKSNRYHGQIVLYNERGLPTMEAWYISDGSPALETPWGYSKAITVYDKIGQETGYKQYLGDRQIYDKYISANEDTTTIETVFLRTEKPGLFTTAGLMGAYVLLKWNNWDFGEDMGKLIEEIGKSNGQLKHLMFCSVTYEQEHHSYGEIIEQTFGEESLGVRIFSQFISLRDIETIKDIYNLYMKNH